MHTIEKGRQQERSVCAVMTRGETNEEHNICACAAKNRIPPVSAVCYFCCTRTSLLRAARQHLGQFLQARSSEQTPAHSMASPAKDVKGKGSEGRRRSSNFLDYLGNELLHVSKFTQMFTGKRDSTDGANGNKEDTGDSAFSESFTVPTPGKFRRGSSFSIARNMVDIAPTLAAANAMCTNDKYSVPEPPDLHEMLDARKLEELQLQISSKSLSKGRAKSVAMEKAKEIESIKKGSFCRKSKMKMMTTTTTSTTPSRMMSRLGRFDRRSSAPVARLSPRAQVRVPGVQGWRCQGIDLSRCDQSPRRCRGHALH